MVRGLFLALCALGCDGSYYNVAAESLKAPVLDTTGPGFVDGSTHYTGCDDYCRREPHLRSLASCDGPAHLDANGNPARRAPSDAGEPDAGVTGGLFVVCRGTWDRSGCDAPFSD